MTYLATVRDIPVHQSGVADACPTFLAHQTAELGPSLAVSTLLHTIEAEARIHHSHVYALRFHLVQEGIHAILSSQAYESADFLPIAHGDDGRHRFDLVLSCELGLLVDIDGDEVRSCRIGRNDALDAARHDELAVSSRADPCTPRDSRTWVQELYKAGTNCRESAEVSDLGEVS